MTSISTSTADAVFERVRQLPLSLSDLEAFRQVLDSLQRGGQATLDGAWGSSCALAAAALALHAPSTLVVTLPTIDAVDDFAEDLRLFLEEGTPGVHRFPAWETDPGERIIHDEIYGERLRLLKSLCSTRGGQSGIIVTSVQSLLQPVPEPEQVAESTRMLRVGERLDPETFSRWLVEHRFHHTSAVELPGEFAVRGGIVDIFAPDWQDPVRIELFDDEIESIRQFSPASQRSAGELTEVEVTVLEPGLDNRAHFSHFLSDDAWVLLVEPSQLEHQGRQYLERHERPDQFHSVRATMRELSRHPLATAAAIAEGSSETRFRLPVESVERFSGEIGRVQHELEQVGDGYSVYVFAKTDAEVTRLSELLSESRLFQTGRLHFPVGTLSQGFRLLNERMLLLSADELFSRGQVRRIPRRRLGKAIDSFSDLREGNLVVHLAHGIGRYRGLKLIDKDDHVEEHLVIEFDGRTKVYVPASRIHLVQKYVGGTKTQPSLAKIGGKTWQRQKDAAETAVMDLAAEMLELQATRASRPGIAFTADTPWQHEFDASFPYQETPDQLDALAAIREDMRSPRPMDRLICGDVGFGKTEVAMRAAFKAVDSGYQVAMLVPTTILAEQHYRTFSERMAEFPFDIAKLSRFCTSAETREVKEGLKSGRIDIVIGTHRLASKDIKFHNLGLVIIDEEQRFGVEVKERLKSLRSSVDVLTLSATPIPRTLHMSLVGVRDISNLETPPEDRIAVETRVTRFKPELIRHAVLRELNRGGQIYFVHNRVNDIQVVEQKLKNIVPEARIQIGHGQMHEHDLERVMLDFIQHRFDLLLATTIVESGLDIPNANTIFIDEADRYGLADLHQLRGRVGRYKHRAYSYLLIDPHKHITPTAAKRLRAIEEFSEMGAGFAISMRDLEIRGAGNLLGTQQSGHIAAVGYELYCQLLENAVRSLRQLPPRISIDVHVDIPGEAYLPHDYVPDMRLKIDLYRRLARIASYDDLQQLEQELRDRFGPLPDPARRMLELTQLKMDAAVWQINAIHREDRYLVFNYSSLNRIRQLSKLRRGAVRVVDEKNAYLTIPEEVTTPEQILELVKSVLQPT